LIDTPRPDVCTQCAPFRGGRKFGPADAKACMIFHESVALAVKDGLLRIRYGELQWSDVIDCGLECSRCGCRFRLAFETYRGSGGAWREDDA
jgi:hypothetical protein